MCSCNELIKKNIILFLFCLCFIKKFEDTKTIIRSQILYVRLITSCIAAEYNLPVNQLVEKQYLYNYIQRQKGM
jgi:hypothetical protein